MELKKKYLIIENLTGKTLSVCDDLGKAQKIRQNILLDKYNKYIKKQEENNGDFVTYWQWYYKCIYKKMTNGKNISIGILK